MTCIRPNEMYARCEYEQDVVPNLKEKKHMTTQTHTHTHTHTPFQYNTTVVFVQKMQVEDTRGMITQFEVGIGR